MKIANFLHAKFLFTIGTFSAGKSSRAGRILAALLLASALLFYLWKSEKDQTRWPDRLIKRPDGPLRISFGTPYFGAWSGWEPYAQAWLESEAKGCGYACDVVYNTTLADAVLFHGRDLSARVPKLPRNHWQHWVYLNMESPMATKMYGYDVSSNPDYRFLFNWTATTMRNSPAYMAYGGWNPRDQPTEGPFYSPQKKRHMAYIAFSNCRYALNGRTKAVERLKRYLDVHVYGDCGDRPLPKDWNVWRQISEQYRYYLSFENAFCRDYITEKFHNNGLDSQAVPVVFGGLSRSDYEQVSPPNSFVYALDFSSMRELAEHLKLLAANETRYASYHEWKKRYAPIKISPLCGICKKLHTDRSTGTFDLSQFYDVSRNCRPIDYSYLD